MKAFLLSIRNFVLKMRILCYLAFPLSLAIILFGVFYMVNIKKSMPDNLFQAVALREITGKAYLWQPPRFGSPRVKVQVLNGGEIFFDCFPIKKTCESFSVGDEIGDATILAFHLSMSSYWPKTMAINNTEILSSNKSATAYAEFREFKISSFVKKIISCLALVFVTSIFVDLVEILRKKRSNI